MAEERACVETVVTLPVEGRFHYTVPEHLEGALEVGHRVLVPFGGRRATAFIVALDSEPPEEIKDKLRPIVERLDATPLLPKDVLALATFAADYYLAPVGEVLKMALPPGLTAASIAKLKTTALGQSFLKGEQKILPNGTPFTEAQAKLLTDAVKGAGVRASKISPKLADPLIELGFLRRKDILGAHGMGGEVEVVERLMAEGPAIPFLSRAPTRRKVFDMLAEGPQDVEVLAQALGKPKVKTALKRLEADKVIRRYKVATSERPSRMPIPFSQYTTTPGESSAQGDKLPTLTEEQREALESILEALDNNTQGAFLLNGVTGSGKTEVYLRSIAHVLNAGHGAIVLVPEIALTPQLEGRFRERFGDEVVVLHSAIADGERRKRWLRLRKGEARIALGARSALWAPVQKLGMIVVDEEHDPSFKQGSDVRYNGRDLALTRARQAGCAVVLGSATPSLESVHLAAVGRLEELCLYERVGSRPMPTIEIVDLGDERRERKGSIHLLSRPLDDKLREVLEQKHQAIIFLNRRGFNTVVFCEDCGEARQCNHCDTSLTFHRAGRLMICHYCGHQEPLDVSCTKCGSRSMLPFGAGTQRVADEIQQAMPDARVLRLDRDSTSRVGSLDEVLQKFRNGEADIMVGTQMVAKGHDFPNVTLVGIILADASLAFPDFRAAERTFQLLTQVAGRAGRAEHPGHVIIQTFQPDHYTLQCAYSHDAEGFSQIEMASRDTASYPPFARIGLIRIESLSEQTAERTAQDIGQIAKSAIEIYGVRVRGPVPAPLARLRDRYRFMVLLFGPTPAKLSGAMRYVRGKLEPPKGVDLIFDVDATDLL